MGRVPRSSIWQEGERAEIVRKIRNAFGESLEGLDFLPGIESGLKRMLVRLTTRGNLTNNEVVTRLKALLPGSEISDFRHFGSGRGKIDSEGFVRYSVILPEN